jgi:hypothetical protein
MVPHVLTVIAELEILAERSSLRELGLTEEEIDGAIEFFMDSYPELKGDTDVPTTV